MIEVLDFAAIRAGVATVDGDAIFSDRVQAIESFGERARSVFELREGITGKKIGVGEAATLERTLQELDALRLGWQIFE